MNTKKFASSTLIFRKLVKNVLVNKGNKLRKREMGNMWARTGNAMAEEGRGPGRHPHTCLRVLGS